LEEEVSRAGIEPEQPIEESQSIDFANRQKRQNRSLSRTEVHSGSTDYEFVSSQCETGHQKAHITAACMDSKAGMKAHDLCVKHIPGWLKHNRYRRIVEQRTLMAAIRSRVRRAG